MELVSFFTFGQTPVRCLMLYLKRGKTLTYGTHESLTYGIGKTLTPFEVLKEGKMKGGIMSKFNIDSALHLS